MAQHAPPESGRRPATPVRGERPDCPDPKRQCSWAFSVAHKLFELKFINGGCEAHRPLGVTLDKDLARFLLGGEAA